MQFSVGNSLLIVFAPFWKGVKSLSRLNDQFDMTTVLTGPDRTNKQ